MTITLTAALLTMSTGLGIQATEESATIEEATERVEQASDEAPQEKQPEIIRLVGDLDVMPESVNGYQWRLGDMFIDTALPEGYPRPTPPEMVEIKTYPSVRRAEISGESSPRSASRRGFFPLFRHIQRNEIAMTSPVEMDLPGWTTTEEDGTPETWTMSFLYRTADLRETGTEGDIVIRDTEPVTVISIGTQGVYTLGRFTPFLERLETWLGEQDEWEQAGPPRWFGYNGPATFPALQWGEVQIPIQKADTASVEQSEATKETEGTDEAPDAADG